MTESKLRLVHSDHYCYVDITVCINFVSIVMTIVITSQSTLTFPVADGIILSKRILTTVRGCELVDWINLARDSKQSSNEHSGYIKGSGWIGGSFFFSWGTVGSRANLCSVESPYLL